MNKIFANNIKAFRYTNSLKQIELAFLLNVDNSTICGWETGRTLPNRQIVDRIEALTGIPIEDLIKYDLSVSIERNNSIEDLVKDFRNSSARFSWDTSEERAKKFTYNGETLSIQQWATRSGITYSKLRNRLIKGMDIGEAIKN